MLRQGRVDRPGYRPYRVAVSQVRPLNDRFTRVTFTGPELHQFGPGGLDQRIKIVFPLPGGQLADFGADDPDVIASGAWYSRWRRLPDARRNPLRTYTARTVRPAERGLDVDFVVHGHEGGGPAARWLSAAATGQELVVVGPDAGSIHCHVGIDWRPGPATDVLLAGDETAVPAISGIVEALPPATRATVLVETEHALDALAMTSAAPLELRWVGRDPAAPGARLRRLAADWLCENTALVSGAQAVAAQALEDVDVDEQLLWESPAPAAGRFYAWLAGEAAVIKELRRLLVTESRIDRRQVAFMGYWRRGRPERQ